MHTQPRLTAVTRRHSRRSELGTTQLSWTGLVVLRKQSCVLISAILAGASLAPSNLVTQSTIRSIKFTVTDLKAKKAAATVCPGTNYTVEARHSIC